MYQHYHATQNYVEEEKNVGREKKRGSYFWAVNMSTFFPSEKNVYKESIRRTTAHIAPTIILKAL